MTSDRPQRQRASLRSTLFLLVAAAVAIAGVAAIWTGAALITRGNAGWMALVAALDAALLVRLAGYPRGSDRAVAATLITGATAVAAGFLLATARIGLAMGLRPADAVGRMSLDLAWLYVSSNAGLIELGWLLGALLLAWKIGR